MSALEKLKKKIESGLHICVGLDTDVNKIPIHLTDLEDPIFEFNKQVIEATKDTAAAYKLNLAFYEKEGSRGQDTMLKTLEIIPDDVLTIGDAKRGDIGNTSKMYAQALFEGCGFDSSTLSPYIGYDSVQPFLEYEDKLNFILVLTSNPSNKDFETLQTTSGKYLYQEVLEKVKDWNTNLNCGIVFGATNPSELSENMNSFGDLPVLLPGVGSQGGSLEEVTELFENAGNINYLVNVSRGLIYCDSTENFKQKISEKLQSYNEIIGGIISK